MEWTVVTVLVVIVGLFAAVGAPIIKLIVTITKVNILLDALTKELNEAVCKNKDSHERFRTHNEKQDETLQDHEMRITVLEQK
jgi:Na+-translocating ferredoxin:NAD+ oxidoreductase RnfG subunit